MWPWLYFLGAAAAILVVSDRLAEGAEQLADHFGVGKGFVGVVLLGAVTSLPELVTTVASVGVVGSPDMAVGNVFGSNLFNILIIGLVDWVSRERKIDAGNQLTAVCSLGVTILVVAGLIYRDSIGGFGRISWTSVVVFAGYLLAMSMLYRQETRNPGPVGEGEEGAHTGLGRIALTTVLSAVVIIFAGMLASHAVGDIAQQTGMGESFAGGLLLAAATSLPELAVTYSAVKRGSTEMAAGNVFGSNLFNLAILPIADVLSPSYLYGSVVVSAHLILALGGMAMTVLAMGGFLLNERRPKIGRLGLDSLLIIVGYLLVLWANFIQS